MKLEIEKTYRMVFDEPEGVHDYLDDVMKHYGCQDWSYTDDDFDNGDELQAFGSFGVLERLATDIQFGRVWTPPAPPPPLREHGPKTEREQSIADMSAVLRRRIEEMMFVTVPAGTELKEEELGGDVLWYSKAFDPESLPSYNFLGDYEAWKALPPVSAARTSTPIQTPAIVTVHPTYIENGHHMEWRHLPGFNQKGYACRDCLCQETISKGYGCPGPTGKRHDWDSLALQAAVASGNIYALTSLDTCKSCGESYFDGCPAACDGRPFQMVTKRPMMPPGVVNTGGQIWGAKADLIIVDELLPVEKKCECGAAKCGSPVHSSWCAVAK